MQPFLPSLPAPGRAPYALPRGVPEASDQRFHVPSPEAAAARTPAPLRVLLVEDNPVNQRVALHLLNRLGYRADVAGNGCEAVHAASQASYDLVFMDVMMPVMDGYEATRQIRRLGTLPTQPRIVALTANAMPGDRERCIDAGMDDYLAKPLQIDALTRILQQTAPPPAPLAVAEPAPAALNFDALRDLREAIGEDDPAFLDSLVGEYFGDAQTLVDDLAYAFQTGEIELARRVAHTLKSSSAMMGAHLLSDACARVDHLLREGDEIGARAAAVSVPARFAESQLALEALRARQFAGL